MHTASPPGRFRASIDVFHFLRLSAFTLWRARPFPAHVLRERNGGLLVIVGFSIIIISIIMGFLLHFRTRIENKSILLNGLWTTRLVKIDLNSIVKVEKSEYSRYLFNNPVYNLHTRGAIRFYTAGKDAIHLTDRDGLIYIIGSQHANEFLRAINEELKK